MYILTSVKWVAKMNISVTKKMIMYKNYFASTVLNILHNEARRIKFQMYNPHGSGAGQN
jgi:hypothetical protein